VYESVAVVGFEPTTHGL